MRRAVATYIARAAEKARLFGLVAQALDVMLTTKHFGDGPHHTAEATARLPWPTAYTPDLLSAADVLVRRVWKGRAPDARTLRYKKAGVTLLGLRPGAPEQGHLFHQPDPKRVALMAAVDEANAKFGQGAIRYGSTAATMGHRRPSELEPWQMRQQQRSPSYTTEWASLLRVS